MTTLQNIRILIMASDGFEQSELLDPRDTLSKAGADVRIATPDGNSIRGWDSHDWGATVDADLAIKHADVNQYEALVLPGGQINPDVLRTDEAAVTLVKNFVAAEKPVAAICHAPWLLIEAKVIDGVEATSYGSIRTDMENAGAVWKDQEVVVDQNIITSRSPADLEAFNKAIIDMIDKRFANGNTGGSDTALNEQQKRMVPA